jgi:molecular chaperone DnaK
VLLKTAKPVSGAEFQLDSLDTGWSSGRLILEDGASVEVPLGKSGDNTFKIFLFDARGGPVTIDPPTLVITRTAATVDAIPSSSSIAFEVLDRAGGRPTLEFLIKAGDPLPKKGILKFKAANSLRSGGDGALRFKLWEGDIEDPVSDNEAIGTLSITGKDVESGGVIPAGAELICDYEISDSGNVKFEVSIPIIGGSFQSMRNLYSRQAAQIDFAAAGRRIQEDASSLRTKLNGLAGRIDDDRFSQIEAKLEDAESVSPEETNPERAKEAMDRVLEAKKIMAQVRRDRLKEMRALDLEACVSLFQEHIRPLARPTEVTTYESLVITAKRAIDRVDSSEFEAKLAELRGRNFEIIWRQDWFVVDRFKRRSEEAHLFPDQAQFKQLIQDGQAALAADDFERLRAAVAYLDSCRLGAVDDDVVMADSNLVRH